MEMVDVPEGGHFVNFGGDNGWKLQFDQGTHTVGTADSGYSQAANISGNALSTAQNAYSGLKSVGENSWLSPEGGIINLDPQTGASTYSPPASSYSATNRFGQNYGVSSLANSPYSYNGQNIAISPTTAQIDPNTGKALSDANGQPLYYAVQDAGQGGNFWNENMMGALKVGAFAAGAYGLDAALGAAASTELASPSLAGSQAYDAAIASGATTTEAAAAGDAATQAAIASSQGIGTATGSTLGTTETGSTLGTTATSSLPQSSSYGTFNAGAPTSGAFSPSGASATQSSLGLGSAPTGLATSSIGMGGTTGAGSLAGIAGSEAAAGLGGANLGYGLTADQLAQYEAANNAINPSDVLNNAKKAKSLSDLLKQGAGSGLASSMGQLAAGQNPSASALPNLVRGNQSPFAYTAQQPIRDAQPMDLNSLANLLKQG